MAITLATARTMKDTGTTRQSGNTAPLKDVDPAMLRYINLFDESQSPRAKPGSIKLDATHPNLGPVVDKLDAGGLEMVNRFIQNICEGVYNPGKGENEGRHFVNIVMVSTEGHRTEIGVLEYKDSNPKDAVAIQMLVEGDDETATTLLHSLTCTYNSGVPMVHSYDF